jgi:membrane protein DedA with SNARE-associated domain
LPVPVAGVTSSLTSLIGNHGVYAVFLLMAIDAVFPAASELVMVYAGALAAGAFAGQEVTLFGTHVSSGFSAYVVMSLAGAVGYLVGAIVGWAIGLYGGRPLLERRGRLFHLPPEKLDRAERWFERWGDWAVFVGRITPVARSFVSIPAGVLEAPLRRYTVLTFIGSTLWCLGFAAAGYALGTRWEEFHDSFRYVDYAVAALVLAGIVWLVARRRRGRLGRRASDPAR